MAGLYLQVEVLELDADALIDAGMEGRGVYLTVGLLAKRTETDGWVTMAQLRKEGASSDAVGRLIELTALEADGDGRVRQVGWLSRNPSQAAIDQRRSAKAEAGKRGNHSKHRHDGPFERCTICHPMQVVAPCEGGAIASDRPGSPYTESETDTQSKSESTPPSISGDLPLPPAPVAEPLPKLTGKALEQAAARSLLRYSQTVATAADAFSPHGLAKSIRADAATDGRLAQLQAWIADGLDPDEAADRLASATGAVGNVGTEAERAAASAAARKREADTAALLAESLATERGDHTAGLDAARAARLTGAPT